MMVDGRVTKTLPSDDQSDQSVTKTLPSDDHFPFCLPAAPRDHQEHTCLSISKERMVTTMLMMMIEESI